MVNDLWMEQNHRKDMKILDQMAYQDELSKSRRGGNRKDTGLSAKSGNILMTDEVH